MPKDDRQNWIYHTLNNRVDDINSETQIYSKENTPMNSTLTNPLLLGAMILTSGLVLSANHAHAGKYDRLKSDGYKTSSMRKNAAGTPGWVLKKDSKRYFCRLKTTVVILNSKTLIGFTSSGRQVGVDRKAYESRSGSVENRYPKMSDVKRGTIASRFVGSCTKMR